MTIDRTAGIVMIVGSTVFMIGAAVGVPGVFTQRDPQVRLRLLTERRRAWRIAQPLYGLGSLIAAAGVAFLVGGAEGGTRVVLATSGATLAIGALAWGWALYLRATPVSDFAFGALPSWPFASYVLLTIAGIALLALGLLIGDFPTWIGWATVADAVFLVVYLRFKDIPPFVFTCSSSWLGSPFSDADARRGLRNVRYGRCRTRTCGHLRVRDRQQEGSSRQRASNPQACVTWEAPFCPSTPRTVTET